MNPQTTFNSERWDVDCIINGDPVAHSTSDRLFALYLLWMGRANDIIDRGGDLLQANTYLKAAEELSTVLNMIYGEKVR